MHIRYICTSKSTPVWFRDENDDLPKNAVINNHLNLLLIDQVTVSDKGYYECQGTTYNDETFYSRVSLTVRSECF